jgi:hypothetical protein
MFRPVSKLLVLLYIISSCCKDKASPQTPDPEPVKTPMVKFVFVNRLGWKKDSVNYGDTYRAFQGPILDSKFYDKKTNTSLLINTAYNRYHIPEIYATKDSITLSEHEVSEKCQFALEVQLRWWLRDSYTRLPIPGLNAKILTFATKNWPYGDTIRVAKDTIIKFIWPLDTNSGRFKKTEEFIPQ